MRRAPARWTLPLLLGALLASAPAHAQVVVFPLDARDLTPETAESATRAVLRALDGIERLRVIDPKTVEARLQVDLTEQARACQYDVFCLVEVGEILETATVLLGHVQKKRAGPTETYELKLVVLDVDRAAISEVLLWRLDNAYGIAPAADAAARRLFGRQDAQVDLHLAPPGARLYLYGDPQPLPRSGPWTTWSGEYRLRVEAEGFVPVERIWQITPGANVLRVSLDPDPLYVRSRAAGPVEPFDRPSRRLGSGVTAKDVVTTPDLGPPPSRFERPWPWVTTGLGVAAVVTGTVLMATAQADYNALAEEVRFSPMTTRSDLARPARDDADRRHRIGGGIAAGGAVVAVGGLLWLLAGGSEDGPSDVSGR